jgi:hypothetical protein
MPDGWPEAFEWDEVNKASRKRKRRHGKGHRKKHRGSSLIEQESSVASGSGSRTQLQAYRLFGEWFRLKRWRIVKQWRLDVDPSSLLEVNQDDVLNQSQVLSKNTEMKRRRMRRRRRRLARESPPTQKTSRANQTSPDSFLQLNQCGQEPMIDSAMKFVGALNITRLEENYFDSLVGLKIRIQKQEVNFKLVGSNEMLGAIRKRARAYVMFLDKLLNEVHLPDMEFVVSLLDRSPGGLGVLKAEGQVGAELLLPSRSSLAVWWNNETNAHYKEDQARSCQKIKPGAVFRGSTTGGKFVWDEQHPLPLHGYRGGVLPRYRVVETSLKRPDLLDAGFTKVVQSDNNLSHQEALKARGFMKDVLPSNVQKCYEAVVVVDGNTIPDRLPEQLAWGRPVVFVHDKQLPTDFFYDEITPWLHYVPATPGNLEELLEALFESENKAMMDCIGRNGQEFVKRRLSETRLKCYTTRLLMGYNTMKLVGVETKDVVQKRQSRNRRSGWEEIPRNWRR